MLEKKSPRWSKWPWASCRIATQKYLAKQPTPAINNGCSRRSSGECNRSPHEANTKPANSKDKQTARFRDRLRLGCKYREPIEHKKVLSGIVTAWPQAGRKTAKRSQQTECCRSIQAGMWSKRRLQNSSLESSRRRNSSIGSISRIRSNRPSRPHTS